MLGKLLKYEFKATARLFLPLYLALLAFALINRFISPFKVFEPSTALLDLQMLISLLSIFIYFALIVGVIAMTVIIMIRRFYTSLLGDEGYLMFTLPVKPWQHIVSKLITAMAWTTLSFLVTVGSIVIIAGEPGLAVQLKEFIVAFQEIFGVAGYYILPGYALAAMASNILMIYAAIALGHLFSKQKLIATFAMYCVLYIVSQLLIILIFVPFVLPFMRFLINPATPAPGQINSLLLLFLLPIVILGAGYFILTNMILKFKLNLE